jgi:tetratricopeptide (TPR) repeat protein
MGLISWVKYQIKLWNSDLAFPLRPVDPSSGQPSSEKNAIPKVEFIENIEDEWKKNSNSSTLHRLRVHLKREKPRALPAVIDEALGKVPSQIAPERVYFLSTLAGMCVGDGRIDDALELLKQYLSTSESLSQEERDDASASGFDERVGIAILHGEKGDLVSAVEKGEEIIQSEGFKAYLQEGGVYFQHALVGFLLDLNRIKEAREYWSKQCRWVWEWGGGRYYPNHYAGREGRMVQIAKRAIEEYDF